MNICSLGKQYYNVSEIEFSSTRTILDFDAVFIDSAKLVEGNGQNPRAIEFRRNEFVEFLALGRTIAVFTAPIQLEVFLPIQPVNLKPIAGKKVDFKGPDHLKVFWRSVQQDMQFLAYFGTVPGQPFLCVSATNKPVATLVKHERGNILLHPYLKPEDRSIDRQQQDTRFIAAFQKLNEHLAPKKPIAHQFVLHRGRLSGVRRLADFFDCTYSSRSRKDNLSFSLSAALQNPNSLPSPSTALVRAGLARNYPGSSAQPTGVAASRQSAAF